MLRFASLGLMMALVACSGRQEPPPLFTAYAQSIYFHTEADAPGAVRLLREAADRGDTRALVNLGVAYERLPSPTREEWEANWQSAQTAYRQAAEKGDPLGQTNYAVAICTERRWREFTTMGPCSEAPTWFGRAADQGHMKALVYLGYMYELGLGGLGKNRDEAIRLYKFAAEKGEEYGAFFLRETSHREPRTDGVKFGPAAGWGVIR